MVNIVKVKTIVKMWYGSPIIRYDTVSGFNLEWRNTKHDRLFKQFYEGYNQKDALYSFKEYIRRYFGLKSL